MLKYIQQFVQTVLREASKSRPKSRKASRSSIDLTKRKSSMRPEILAIDFNVEGQEAERSKEILELKRTYSLLMKKFVNPKLDLMAGTKTGSDINILSLRAKQELIRSVLNKIFYESPGQQKKLDGTSRDFSTVNIKPIIEEELSFGWSGQRTSKLASNPMVEKSSHSNKIATGLSRYNPKKQSTQLDEGDSSLQESKSSSENKKEYISVYGTINTNVNDESFKKDIAETGELGTKHFPPKEIYKENLQPSLHLELNNLSDTNENLSQYKKDVIQFNQKKNLNMIRSITKVDQNETKSDVQSLKEKKNEKMIAVVKSTNTDQNKAIRNQNNIPQKIGKNVKTSADKQKTAIEIIKKNKSRNDKNVESSSSNKIIKKPLPDPMPQDPLPAIKETSKPTNVTKNEPSEKVVLSQLNCDTKKETEKENTPVTGENLSKTNHEPLEKEQNHMSCNNEEITVYDSKEPPNSDGMDQAKPSIERSIDEPINEKTKSIAETYWSYISNKLLQTGNDAQQFINSLEISNWKTKNISTSDAVNRDLIGKKISDKPIDENSEHNNKNISINSPTVGREEDHFLNKKLFKEVNSKEPQAKRSRTKISKSKYTSKETDSSSKKSSNNFIYYNEAHVSKTKSTASFHPRNHEKHRNNLHSKESNINSNNNIIPEGDRKIKTLVRRFKKIQKNKSKTNIGNVQRIYNKYLNDDNIDKSSLYKLKINKDKNFIKKIRKVIRTKSDNLPTEETLLSDIPVKIKSHSVRSESKIRPLGTSKTKIKINKTDKLVNSTKAPNKLAVKVNRLDSNVFTSVSSNINHEYVKGADQSTVSNLVEQSISKQIEQSTMYDNSRKTKTDFDLTKPRRLHSKKEICKATNLKMYAAKRSIYTHSNHETTLSKSIFNEGDCKNIGQTHFSNMTSSSLIKVSKVTPKLYQNRSCLLTTQVKHLHTTIFTSNLRGKVRQLPKKRTTIIKGNSRTKPVDAYTTPKISPIVKDAVNISKPEEIELKSEPCQSTNKGINKVCTYLSPKSDVIKESSFKMLESNRVSQNKRTDNNINSSVKDARDLSLLSSSIENKVNDNIQVLYSKPEKNEFLPTIHSLKKETMADTTSNATPLCPDVTVKSDESALNLQSQNDQSSQGNETVLDSPKWKSRADRLEKWKLEVAYDNTPDTDNNTNVQPENHSNEVKIGEIKINDNTVTIEKEFGKKDSSVDQESKSIMHLVKVEPEAKIEQKVMRDTTTYNDFGNKTIKGEHENKKSQKDLVKPLEQKVKKDTTTYNDFGNKTIKADHEDKKSQKGSGKLLEEEMKKNTTSFNDSGNKIIKVEYEDKKSLNGSGKLVEQKVKINATSCNEYGNKNIKTELEDKMSQRGPGKPLDQNVKKDIKTYNDSVKKVVKVEYEGKKLYKEPSKPREQKGEKDTTTYIDSVNNITKQHEGKKSLKDPGIPLEKTEKRDTKSYNNSGNKIIKADHEDKKPPKDSGKPHPQKVKQDTIIYNNSGNKMIKVGQEDQKSKKEPGKYLEQKLKRDTTTYNYTGNNIIKVDHEDQKSQKYPAESLSKKNCSIQNKSDNNITPIKIESNNEVVKFVKADVPPYKLKEFESKLSRLESKLKALEVKSLNRQNSEPLLKSQAQKTMGVVPSSVERNRTAIDKNKTGDKAVNLNKEYTSSQNNINNKNSQSVRSDSTFQNKDKLGLTLFEKYDKSDKKSKNDPMREHLSKKVKNLELKLKSLETTIQDLKVKPRDSVTSIKEQHKINSLSRTSEENIKRKFGMNTGRPKLDEKKNNLNHESNAKLDNLYNENQNNIKIQNKESYGTTVEYTKPEAYLTQSKSSLEDKNQSLMNKNIMNNVNNLKNASVSPSPEISSSMKELNLKDNNVKSIKKSSEEISKQKLLHKIVEISRLNETKKNVSHLSSKAEVIKTRDFPAKSNVTTIKGTYDTTHVKQNKSGQNFHPVSVISSMSNNNTNVSGPLQSMSGMNENLKENKVKTVKKSPEKILKQNLLLKSVMMLRLNEANKNVSHIQNSADVQKTRDFREKSNVKIIKDTCDNTTTINQNKPVQKLQPASDVSSISNNNASVPPPHQRISGVNELNLKDKNVKTVKKSSEKILKQNLLPKSFKVARLKESKKNVSQVENKPIAIPIKGTYDKTTYFKQISSMINESNTDINLKKSVQNLNPVSVISSISNINLTLPKRRELSKSQSNVTVQFNKGGASKNTGLGSKIFKVKRKNKSIVETKIKNTASKKKSLKKSPSFSIEKKTSLKRNPKKLSVKKGYVHSDRGTHMVKKRNTLHEGLVKSMRYLNLEGSGNRDTMMNVTGKVGLTSQKEHPTCEQNLKPPELPKRILKTLSNLTIIQKKQEDSKSSNSETEKKLNTDSTNPIVKQTKVKTNQNFEKKYNSFDYYRPKRRTHEVKHPIEKEKYVLKFHTSDENIHDKLYLKHLSQNPTLRSEFPGEREKRENLTGKFHNKGDQKWDPLIILNNSVTVKPARNKVVL